MTHTYVAYRMPCIWMRHTQRSQVHTVGLTCPPTTVDVTEVSACGSTESACDELCKGVLNLDAHNNNCLTSSRRLDESRPHRPTNISSLSTLFPYWTPPTPDPILALLPADQLPHQAPDRRGPKITVHLGRGGPQDERPRNLQHSYRLEATSPTKLQPSTLSDLT